ncbi:MAG: GAF domain-containing protein, partial [Chloroflexota bacterium]
LQPVPITLNKGPQGQYYNAATDISSLFIPTVAISRTLKNSGLSLALNRDVEMTAYLDLTLQAVKNNNPNAAAVYLGTANDVLRYYPNIELGKLVPPDFAVTQRPWYLTALEGNRGQAEVRPVWSPVYYDATGLGMVTTVAVPVYAAQQHLVGVAGIDITLTEIQRSIESGSFTAGSYSFLIDDLGRPIILPERGWQDLLGRPAPTDLTQPEASPVLAEQVEEAALRRVLQEMQQGREGFESLSLNGQEYFIAYAPFQSSPDDRSPTGWSLATLVPAADVLGSVARLESEMRRTTQALLFGRILPVGALLAVLLIWLAWLGTNRLVDPLLRLARAARLLGEGDWDAPLPELRRIETANSDEIGQLAHTLSGMSAQLRQSFGRLEQRVAERTEQLERRSLQIQTAAQVAQEITLARDLPGLLQSAVDLISKRFDYYNVGIFLVDETGRYARLKAASGQLGQKLIEQEIRLRVGGQSSAGAAPGSPDAAQTPLASSIVGYVTRFGQARLVNNVLADRDYLAVPLLADTRSEMALPLRSGPKIVGALDIQSTRLEAFSEEDAVVLQTLADQLATAIENLRLVERLQATLQETSALTQRQARQAWEQLGSRAAHLAYEYDLLEVRPLPSGQTTGAQAAGPAGAGSAEPPAGLRLVPVRLRDQVIGTIGVESDDPQHVWTADELAIVEAVANQAALSVENARLLEESQRRAAREQLAAEVTTRMRASLDLEVVLDTAMRELAQRLGIAQVQVQLDPGETGEPHNDAALASARSGNNGHETA